LGVVLKRSRHWLGLTTPENHATREKHISRPRKRLQSAPAVLRSPAKKVKRKQWTDTQMKAALEAVASGSSVNRAAVDHGVPPTMLKDRPAGRA